MTAEQTPVRVLIALEFESPSRDVLQALPQLAGAKTMELTGLLIEDKDLLAAAGLPVFREITMAGSVSGAGVEHLRRDLAARASRLRGSFVKLAEDAHVRYRFDVARGRHVDEVSRAAQSCDFVVLCRAQRGHGLPTRVGAQFRPLLEQSKTLLFVNEPWLSGSSVVVLHEQDNAAFRHALSVANAYAEHAGLQLTIVSCVAAATAPGDQGRVYMAQMDAAAVAEVCRLRDARLLVLPGSSSLSVAELLPRLLDVVPCSLLRLDGH